MSDTNHELEQVCIEFAGGMIASGTECIVVIKNAGTTVSSIEVVSGTPKGNPRDLIEKISYVSGVSMEDVEIFVYVICGGARGRDL